MTLLQWQTGGGPEDAAAEPSVRPSGRVFPSVTKGQNSGSVRISPSARYEILVYVQQLSQVYNHLVECFQASRRDRILGQSGSHPQQGMKY